MNKAIRLTDAALLACVQILNAAHLKVLANREAWLVLDEMGDRHHIEYNWRTIQRRGVCGTCGLFDECVDQCF